MASGSTLITFDAAAGQPPATGYATLDVRNTHVVLDFDPSSEEGVLFEGVIPRHYSGGGITARLYWMATTGVGPGLFTAWFTRIERHAAAINGGLDLDGDGYAAAGFAYSEAPTVNGQLAYVDIPIAAGGLVGGEHFRLQLLRVAGDASDNLPSDAELLAVELRET